MRRFVCVILVTAIILAGCSGQKQPESSVESSSGSRPEYSLESQKPVSPEIAPYLHKFQADGWRDIAFLVFEEYFVMLALEPKQISSDLWNYNSTLKVVLVKMHGEDYQVIDTDISVRLKSPWNGPFKELPDALPGVTNAEFEERDGYLISNLTELSYDPIVTILADDKLVVLSQKQAEDGDGQKIAIYVFGREGLIYQQSLTTQTDYTQLLSEIDGVDFLPEESRLTLERSIFRLVASPDGIEEQVDIERWNEIRKSIPLFSGDFPVWNWHNPIIMVYDPVSDAISRALFDTAYWDSEEAFADINEVPDDYFVSNLIWHAQKGSIEELKQHQEYGTIKAVLEMRGCGDCILPIEHAEAYIREYYGVERPLSGYAPKKTGFVGASTYDAQLGFFYSFHGGGGASDEPLVLSYRHEGDLIRANVVYVRPAWFGVEAGRHFSEGVEKARQGRFDMYTFRTGENGRMHIVSHDISTPDHPLPDFPTELVPYTDGVKPPPPAKEHPLYNEVDGLLRSLTSYSRIEEASRNDFAYDPGYQLFMMAYENNDLLLEQGMGMTADEYAQLKSGHPDYSVFVHVEDINALGRYYFGEEFSVRKISDSHIFSLDWSDESAPYTINDIDLEKPHLNFDYILSITQRTGENDKEEIVIKTLPLALSPLSNGVFWSHGTVAGYMDDEAYANFDTISDWSEHIYLRGDKVIQAQYTLTRSADGHLMVRECSYEVVELSQTNK